MGLCPSEKISGNPYDFQWLRCLESNQTRVPQPTVIKAFSVALFPRPTSWNRNDFKPLEFVATYARKRLTRPKFHCTFGGLRDPHSRGPWNTELTTRSRQSHLYYTPIFANLPANRRMPPDSQWFQGVAGWQVSTSLNRAFENRSKFPNDFGILHAKPLNRPKTDHDRRLINIYFFIYFISRWYHYKRKL